MRDMKTVEWSAKRGGGPKILHVEADGCIVNIHVGLHDADGRPVTRISVEANADRYSGDPEWWIEGRRNEKGRGTGIRVIQLPPRRRSRRSRA